MADTYVHLHLDIPSVVVLKLAPKLQTLWNDIQFYKDAQQYTEYDHAWELFLNEAMDEILDQIREDFGVINSKETRG